MAANTPQDILQQEILADGRRRAERLIKSANDEAEKTLADRRTALDAEVARIVEDGRQRARKRADMILRTVEQEVDRRKLMAREAVIQDVLDAAGRKIEDLSGREYEDLLVELAAFAIRQMCASEFMIQFVSPRGDGLDPEALGNRVAATLTTEGRKVSLRPEEIRGPSRGVIVLSLDGRLRWDNTIEARLRRLRGAIRIRIAPILFEES
jgi:vacuolar-type H+-ATPase subunit E/Vma4